MLTIPRVTRLKKPLQFDQSFIVDIISGSSNSIVDKKDKLRKFEAKRLESSNCYPDCILLYWAQMSRKWLHFLGMKRDILMISAIARPAKGRSVYV
jgi:hypothetical protein